MPKKTAYSKVSATKTTSMNPTEEIEVILKLYKNDKQKARIAVEEQARRIWLQYLFQQHKEVCTTVELEETEEQQQICGGGNPDGTIITTRIVRKTTTKTTTPKTPVWAIKAALTADWTVNKKHGELEALSLCVEAGLMPESVLDAVTEYATGFGKVLESQMKSADPTTPNNDV
jgi:hypothetical protein